MPLVIKSTEKRVRDSLKLTVRNAMASCGNVIDNAAIAVIPGVRFKKLDFSLVGPRPTNEGVAMGHLIQKNPQNALVYRYFSEIPKKTDPGFHLSRWSKRLLIVPYPPSTAEYVEQTCIENLKLGGRNVGLCLVLKVVLPPKYLDAAHVLVEDSKGTWQMLHIFDLPYTNHPEDRIAEGQLLLIKEPYYYIGLDNIETIRVDHATDIIYIMHDHPMVPAHWQKSDIHGQGVEPKVMKWDGEVRMKWRKYHQAIDCLNLGMKMCEKSPQPIVLPKKPNSKATPIVWEDEILKLRVGAYYYAGYHELCMEDADTIMAKRFDEKAAWYKANCFFKMRQYDEAKRLLLKVIRAKYKFKECGELLMLIAVHTKHLQGQYRMDHILQRCNEGKTSVKVADYVSGIRVRKSPVHGYGLFATKNFKAGEIVFACKAFASIGQDENRPLRLCDSEGRVIRGRYGHKLTARIIEKMYCEPKSVPLIYKIFAGKDPMPMIKDKQGMVLIDSFFINALVEHNSIQYDILTPRIDHTCQAVDSEYFSDEKIEAVNANNTEQEARFDKENVPRVEEPLPNEKNLRSHAGFWIPWSFVNHSCIPNVRQSIFSDIMFVVASVDIPSGTEFFTNYMDDDYGPFEDRRAFIKEKWDFDCLCPRCSFEMEYPNYFKTRGRVQDAVEGLIFGGITSHLPSQLSGVRTCIDILESNTRDTPHEVPKFDLVYCLMAEEFLRRKFEPKRLSVNQDLASLRFALRVIRALGAEFEFTWEDLKFLRHGFVCKWLVEAYMLATVSTARFYGPVHWRFRTAAQTVYSILSAEAFTFEDVLKARLVNTVGTLTTNDMYSYLDLYETVLHWRLDKTELA